MKRILGRSVWGWVCGTLCVLTQGQAWGDIIVAYDATNAATTAAPSQLGAGVTGLPLARGPGLNDGSGATFNSTGWNNEATDYLEWGWSASQPLHLTDVDLRYDRSSSGPAQMNLQLSVNGGAFASIFTDSAVSVDGEDVLNIDLSSYTSVTSAVFRLLGSNASSGTGTFDLEPITGLTPARAIVVNGIAAIPEPSSWCLAATIGVTTIGPLRRWRRTSCAR